MKIVKIVEINHCQVIPPLYWVPDFNYKYRTYMKEDLILTVNWSMSLLLISSSPGKDWILWSMWEAKDGSSPKNCFESTFLVYNHTKRQGLIAYCGSISGIVYHFRICVSKLWALALPCKFCSLRNSKLICFLFNLYDLLVISWKVLQLQE